MKDEKYIVFKREDLADLLERLNYSENTIRAEDFEMIALDDATVIRGQDLFAGPALHAYAAAITIAVKILPRDDEDARKLSGVADYFSERAAEADALSFKLPD